MGGIGKSTLARKVSNAPSVEKHFDLRMWLNVTAHGFSPSEIAKTMIEIATKDGFLESELDTLQSNLRKLIGSKKYLLVLDDVWNENPAIRDDVKALLTFGAHGSSVLVTTRSLKVAAIMGTSPDHEYRLKVLSDDDCLELFKRKAFREGEESPNLVRIGTQIVGKCGGLPLAAKALGSLMPGMAEDFWKDVLKSEIWNLEVGECSILPALMLSYSHLPPDVKQCFALCSLFTKGQAITKETLIRLWKANGYLQSETNQVLNGNTIFRKLEQRSLLEEVKEVARWYDGKMITTFKMHDLIHDLARYVSGTDCCKLQKWEEISTSKSRHLLVNYKGKTDKKIKNGLFNFLQCGSNPSTSNNFVRTLLFESPQNDEQLPPLLISWSKTKYLRVLGLHNMGISEFPTEICELRHLRYLDLSHNNIQTIPEALARLAYLHILDLSACKLLLGLPNCIGYMLNLTQLYLEGCCNLRCMPAGMGHLSQLQLLTKYVIGSQAGSGTLRELSELDLHGMLELSNLKNVIPDAEEDAKSILGTKQYLDKLELDWGEPAGDGSDAELIRAGNTMTEPELLQALRPHENLKYLKIRYYQGTRFPHWLMRESVYLSNLVELTLADCNGSDQLPLLGQLPSLEILEILVMKFVKHMMYNSVVFPLLWRLKLQGMDSLEEWSNGSTERRAFSQLRDIEVIDCPKLKTMPVIPSTCSLKIKNCPLLRPARGFFGCMTNLEKLELESCEYLTLQMEQEDGPPMRSLNSLTIKRCQELMFSSASVGMWRLFRSLEKLSIIECEGLVILPIDILRCLSSLKDLKIHNCHYLVGSSSSEVGLKFQGLPTLENLDIQVCILFPCFFPDGLSQLTGVKRMRIYSNHALTELPDFSDSLLEVTIYNCWNLRSLPVGLGSLPKFERLVLLNLNKVDSLPEGSYMTLKTLIINDCPILLSFPRGILNRLPEVEYLEIAKAPDLQKLCSPGGEYWPYVEQIPTKNIEA